MVSPQIALGAVGLWMQMQRVKMRKESEGDAERQARDRADAPVGSSGDLPAPGAEGERMNRVERLLEEQIKNEKLRQPPADAVDAYVGRTFTLNPGDTAIVEVTPEKGSDLRVERVELDRRDDHEYHIGIDGKTLSGSHRAMFQKPRPVRHGGKVFAEVTNNTSSTTTTLDFELEGWTVVA